LSVGLFGGSFDPPHDGHVALVRAAKAALGLDRVLVLVAADPGHKRIDTPAWARLELARAAFPGDEVLLDDHARTADLLRDHPEWDDPIFLLGADAFIGLPGWKEPAEVLRLARLGVATRPGYPQDRIDATLARLDAPERVLFFELEPHAVSSHDLRTRLARGEDPVDGLPEAVRRIVERDGLYRVSAPEAASPLPGRSVESAPPGAGYTGKS
jgi:nicotinate-nucleotide adenylyltransferase